jgi:protein-L-isoaspartate(D-aspartate) O-methyltransferase
LFSRVFSGKVNYLISLSSNDFGDVLALFCGELVPPIRDYNRADGWSGRRQRLAEELRRLSLCEGAVLDAFHRVPRHLFVDSALADSAYGMGSLPIGCGQTISSPATQARMTMLVAPRPTDRVLEVGTGSGYQTAILAEVAAWVLTIEMHAALVNAARSVLDSLGYRNILFRVGDGVSGWREAAPFSAIVVTAGAPRLPVGLLPQLADGGRLVCPVGAAEEQQLIVVRRHRDRFEEQVLDSCRFVPLTGEEGW